MLDADRHALHATSLLDLLERTWAHRLRGLSLATEIDADDVMIEAAADALGKVYRRLRDGRHRELAERWPACVVVAMAGVAATGYRSGSYWPRWWAAAHYQGRVADGAAFGEVFLRALRALGLPDFPGQAGRQKYLGPIMVHAGIPTSCLARFFRFLLDGRPPHQVDGLDAPVRQFLLHGGDYAADLAERCLDLLERLRSPDPELDGLVLPTRIVDHARALVRDGLLDLTRDGERPRLMLAPFGQGIHLRFPEEEGPWVVEVDGEAREVRPGTTFTIARPAGAARIARRGTTGGTAVDLVDPADPLLIFTEDGRQLPGHRSLPPDTVWVAHPKDHRLAADAPLRVVAESLLPLGWVDWRLVQVSLEGATWLALDGGPRRPVRGKDRPRVLTGEPLAAVTTPAGSPVFATAPSVWLPGGDITWSVTVRRAGSNQAVFRGSYTAAEPVEVTELWDTAPRPVLGAFTVMVRGPIGRGTRRTVVVAEGLAVRCEPEVRLCAADGLVPASARVLEPGGTATTLAFSPRETERAFTCGTELFVLTPPHMRVTAGDHEWSAGPLHLPLEALDAAESLRVDVPQANALPPLSVRAGNRTVQELAPSARGHYSLRRILDTVTAHHGADLVLPPDVPVAFIRPAGSVSGVEHHGDRLVLADVVWAEGLLAGIYLEDRRPEIVPVERDGTIPLPPHLTGAGPLRIRLAVPDAWVAAEWPVTPPADALVCQSPYAARTD